jgi:hypothetical protein
MKKNSYPQLACIQEEEYQTLQQASAKIVQGNCTTPSKQPSECRPDENWQRELGKSPAQRSLSQSLESEGSKK